MTAKRIHLICFSSITACGLVFTPLFAQTLPEDETAEVDRILTELGEEEVETTEAIETTETQAAPETAETPSTPAGQADAVPPIQLTEDRSLPGLEPGTTDDSLISITYDDVLLADVVRIFARFSGANIIIPEGLDERVSANLHDVDWRHALEAILAEKNYALVQRRANIYTIVREDQLAAEPLARETLELKYITVEQALPAVEGMLISSNARVIPLPAANRIVVVETPRNIEEIRTIISGVDQPRQQVFIEAKFVELNDQAIKDLGINWQVLQGYTVRATGLSSRVERIETRTSQDAQAFVTTRSRSSTRSQDTMFDNLDPTSSTDIETSNITSSSGQLDSLVRGRNFDSFDAAAGTISTIPAMEQTSTRAAVLSADDFALTLSALQQLDGVRIVSNPKMLVANNETATIHVGRNEPNIRAIPQGENATTFAYVLDGFIEIGVKLEVTPSISTERNITVKIIPELSRLIGEKSVGEAGTSFPVTQIRRINTEFALQSGKTVAIGGLTQGEDKEVVRKVPLLGDLPLIGKYLFRHTRTERFQDEVVIFVSVDMAHVESLDDRFGIPERGDLIHRWMHEDEARKQRVAAALNEQAAVVYPEEQIIQEEADAAEEIQVEDADSWGEAYEQ
ncbi:MAG: hypothetical protein JJU29_21885 [Verrucomicrobia bacterium]|nr:hypothetical protein [Verrucomicrobiota bacterium]